MTRRGMSVVVATLAFVASGAIAATSPIGHWKLDEAAGSTAADETGNYPGTLNNFPVDDSQWVAGQIDGALSCAGTSDYVNVSGLDGWHPTTFTVSFWLKPAAFAEWNQMVGSGWNEFLFHSGPGGVVFCGIDSGSGERFTDNNLPAGTLVVGEWHHYAYTFDNGVASFYKDGNELASGRHPMPQTWNGFRIGTSSANTINGLVDDVRVYDRALSEGEVAMLLGQPGICIVPWLRLETTEAGGTATFDVNLSSQPTEDVTVTLASSDSTEGAVTQPASGSLTFTTTNWVTPQTVVITGQDDTEADGHVSYSVTLTGASGDSDYVGELGQVEILNRDDDIDADLVAWWKLDEAAGATQAEDASGSGNRSYYLDGAAAGASGTIDGAWSFDGNDYIAVPETAINPPAGTICGWIYLDRMTDDSQRLFGTHYAYNPYHLYVTPTGIVEADINERVFGSRVIGTGEWHHLAVTWVRYGAGVVYVDGVASGSVGSVGGTGTPARATLGAWKRSTVDGNLAGMLDDVRIYSRALSTAEVMQVAMCSNRWWVGGTGNWSDAGNWAYTAGGSGVAPVPTASDSVAFDANSGGTCTLTGAAVATGVCLTDDTTVILAQGANALDIGERGYLQAGGTFTATSGTLSVAGDFRHTGGTFDHADTVMLNGLNQRIIGSTTFADLTKTTSERCTLTFEAGATQTVTGTLTLQGESGNMLRLRSTAPGTQWMIDPQGTETIADLSVADSANISSPDIDATGTGSIDWGNNTGWTFDAGAEGVEIVGPAASATSPACIEVVTREEMTAVTFTVGGSSIDAVQMDATHWYLDETSGVGAIGVELDEDASVSVAVTANDGGATPYSVTHVVTWAPTDISGKTAGSDTVVIRKGDSLLLTASTGKDIDADGNGEFELSGKKGDEYPVLYDIAGEVIVTAKTGNNIVGSLTVVVIEIAPISPIACQLGYRREKDIEVSLPEHADKVYFGTTDVGLLEVGVEQLTATGATILLKAHDRGTLVLTARIGNAMGSIITTKEIDELTLDVPARCCIPSINGSPFTSMLTMRPFIADLDVEFDMFASQATFEGGLTYFMVNTSDLDPVTGQPFFDQVFDPQTGEMVGRFEYIIEIPEEVPYPCFNIAVLQEASPRIVRIALEFGVNGRKCDIDVEIDPSTMLMCPGSTNHTLTLEVVAARNELPVYLSIAIDGLPASPPPGATPLHFTWASRGTVTNAKVTGFLRCKLDDKQYATVDAGTVTGVYDLKISTVTVSDYFKVDDNPPLSVSVSGPAVVSPGSTVQFVFDVIDIDCVGGVPQDVAETEVSPPAVTAGGGAVENMQPQFSRVTPGASIGIASVTVKDTAAIGTVVEIEATYGDPPNPADDADVTATASFTIQAPLP